MVAAEAATVATAVAAKGEGTYQQDASKGKQVRSRSFTLLCVWAASGSFWSLFQHNEKSAHRYT